MDEHFEDRREYLISVAEAATLTGVSRVTVKRWINTGLLPAYRIGARQGRFRIDKRDLASVVRRVDVDGAA